MTRQVLFVQGGGEGVHDQWDDKLVASLEHELGKGCAVRYPRMPNEADSNYAAWKAALLGEFDSLEDGAIVVGHSIGGCILIHSLAQQRASRSHRPGGLFLIAAPFIGEGGWLSDGIKPRPDLSERLPPGVPTRSAATARSATPLHTAQATPSARSTADAPPAGSAHSDRLATASTPDTYRSDSNATRATCAPDAPDAGSEKRPRRGGRSCAPSSRRWRKTTPACPRSRNSTHASARGTCPRSSGP